MEFFIVESDNYENALKKARRRYGWNIIVHQRRDFYRGFSVFSKARCEITCYIPEGSEKKDNEVNVIDRFEFEAKTFKVKKSRDEDSQSQYARSLLEDNGFSQSYIDNAISKLQPMLKDADNLTVEHVLYSYIRSVIDIDVSTQLYCPACLAFIGLANSGKSLMCSNILDLLNQRYSSESIKLIKLSVDQTSEDIIKAEKGLYNLIDCYYPENKEDVLAITRTLESLKPKYCLVIDSSDPENLEQMDKLCALFPFSCASITKLDQAKNIGQSLSFLYDHKLKVYALQNSEVPVEGFKLASSSLLMERVKSLRI